MNNQRKPITTVFITFNSLTYIANHARHAAFHRPAPRTPSYHPPTPPARRPFQTAPILSAGPLSQPTISLPQPTNPFHQSHPPSTHAPPTHHHPLSHPHKFPARSMPLQSILTPSARSPLNVNLFMARTTAPTTPIPLTHAARPQSFSNTIFLFQE